MEAAAELVVHAAARHPSQREPRHVERSRIPAALPETQYELPVHRLRKLGSSSDAAVSLVELPGDALIRTEQDLLREEARRPLQPLAFPHVLEELTSGLDDVATARAIGFRHRLQHTR